MPRMKICQKCGAKIEIEDKNNLEPMQEILPHEEEDFEDGHDLCDECIEQQILNKN